MSDICETYERNKLKVNIFYDTSPENPRDWDNMGIMICSHRRYTLGDEQFSPDDYNGWEDLAKHLYNERNAGLVLPVGLYDHSGISLYVGDKHDRWDGGQVGFIYVTNETLEKEYGVIGCDSIEKATEVLKGEVETYSQYLEGEVYGFTITNPKNEDEIDSCWGIYGLDGVRREANAVADSYKHPHEAAYAKNASVMHG